MQEIKSLIRSGDGRVVAETQSIGGQRSNWMSHNTQPFYDKIQGKDSHHLVLEEVQTGVEEERNSKVVSL